MNGCGYQLADHLSFTFSIAFTESTDLILAGHLDKGIRQEDLTFAYWRPSIGKSRYTAIIYQVILPSAGDRELHGNVAFTPQYLKRVLRDVPKGCGIALLHSHLGPGWQDMSEDDVIAERDRMGGAVAARTNLPIVGLTRGTDGTWSGRFWFREGPNKYQRKWASTVRAVGHQLKISHHPILSRASSSNGSQVATVSVWGDEAQANFARAHVGIVGLGSVGSILTESLSRTGIQKLTLIDFDRLEERNLDRTLNATYADVDEEQLKVDVAKNAAQNSHTSSSFSVTTVPSSLSSEEGFEAALDADVLMSCVDRPYPRHILNTIAKAHLIPVIDGGILSKINKRGEPLHVDWRIHIVGPEQGCLYCIGALRRSDVSLDIDGMLDDPDYIANLAPDDITIASRRNVFAFSLSVASHMTLQCIGLLTGMKRIGGTGYQHYSAYPGRMSVTQPFQCNEDCDIRGLTGSAIDLYGDTKHQTEQNIT